MLTRTAPLLPYTTLFRSNTLRPSDFRTTSSDHHRQLDESDGARCTTDRQRDERVRRTQSVSSASKRRRSRQPDRRCHRSEEHTSELQSLTRITNDVFCLKKKISNI